MDSSSVSTADWLAIIGLLVAAGIPLLSFFAAVLHYAAKGIRYLGAIQKTLDNLENWMKAFGEDHAELKARVDRLEKRVAFQGAILFGGADQERAQHEAHGGGA